MEAVSAGLGSRQAVSEENAASRESALGARNIVFAENAAYLDVACMQRAL